MHFHFGIWWVIGALLCCTTGFGLGMTFAAKRFSFQGGTAYATCILMGVTVAIFAFARMIGLIIFVDCSLALGMMIGTVVGLWARDPGLALTRHSGRYVHKPYHPPSQERTDYEQQPYLLMQ